MNHTQERTLINPLPVAKVRQEALQPWARATESGRADEFLVPLALFAPLLKPGDLDEGA